MAPNDSKMPEETSGGAPAWMLTYADAVTLLVTFFVMLMTFSTPNKDDYRRLAQGLHEGMRPRWLPKGGEREKGVSPDELRLAAGRLSDQGAEKPPLHDEAALDELQDYYDDIEIAELPKLRGARSVRIPVGELFDTGTTLTRRGQNVLDLIVKMAKGQRCSIIVRAATPPVVPPEQRPARSCMLGTRVVAYLRREVGDAVEDVGLSGDIEFVMPPLPEGRCEIILMEG